MIDKKISYKNILMRCDLKDAVVIPVLPGGYRFDTYRNGDNEDWAEIEVAINDFDTKENAVKYFNNNYVIDMDKLIKRYIAVRSPNDETVGFCIAWHDHRGMQAIPALQWLAVHPNEQNNGIGRGLIAETLRRFFSFDEKSIYLHTQPWSYKAIRLYSAFGFRILKTETFSHYENQYDEAISVLSTLLDAATLKTLVDEAI